MPNNKTKRHQTNFNRLKWASCERDDFTRKQQPNPADKGKQPYEDNQLSPT
ncbi:hypothetical protein [Ursidibacter sp. B-7004-1]